jgi:CRP-like cAMP-binding protein
MKILDDLKKFCLMVAPELGGEAYDLFEKTLIFKTFEKNEPLLKEGEICKNVFYIHTGLIRFYFVADGREITTGFMADNQFASDYSSFLLQKPSQKNIEALYKTETVFFTHEVTQKLYKTIPAFQIFGRRMAENLFLTFDEENTRLNTLNPEARYLRLINKSSPLLQKIPQYMLASYLGITPEHLSRIRKKISAR